MAQTAVKPLSAVLVKPAGPDCNMCCSYCFYLEKASLFPAAGPHRMTEACLEEMIRQCMEQAGPEISFGWQGGEPTLMGLSFFEKAVAFQKRYGRRQTVGNGLQTNGLLIDVKWIPFLAESRFLVGLSIDGPEHVHDKYRVLKGGQGTHGAVKDRAKALLDGGVEVNALTVVNDYSVRFPEEIYGFHKDLGLTFMQFIPLLCPKEGERFLPSPEAYGKFLITLFDLWLHDFKAGRPTTSIRFFDSLFHLYAGLSPPECTLLKTCGVYLVVEHNGDVFACDFYVEPAWKLGNVNQGALKEMLNSEAQERFGRLKADLPDRCYECPWLRYCRGGCPGERRKGLHRLCDAFKAFFQHADPHFLRIHEAWKADRPKPLGPTKTGRNDPCPCGSNKKFKKCCGRAIRE